MIRACHFTGENTRAGTNADSYPSLSVSGPKKFKQIEVLSDFLPPPALPEKAERYRTKLSILMLQN